MSTHSLWRCIMEKDKRSKEERILEAAIEIFAEKGYNGTTTKEIAMKAGVAEGTIFRYFPKKRDILHSILLKLIEILVPKIVGSGLKEIFEECKDKNDKEIIMNFVQNRMNLFDTHVSLIKVIINEVQYHPDLQEVYFEKVVPQISDILVKFFEEGIKRERFKNKNPHVMTVTLLGCMASNIMGRKILTGEKGLEKLLEESVEIFLYGISRCSED